MPPIVFIKSSKKHENVEILAALDVFFTINAKKIVKKLRKNLVEPKNSRTFATANKEQRFASLNGVLTERLGNGLQNRVERFDSARHLKRKGRIRESSSFSFVYMQF